MISFSHPLVNKLLKANKTAAGTEIYSGNRKYITKNGDLQIQVNPNEIKWGYHLNTVTYPTYGGEVVQVLSANILDLTVGGTVPTYRMMEDIYLWFLVYMSVSTQGHTSVNRPDLSTKPGWGSKYNEEPVTMWYSDRKWMFKLKPKTLPGFKLGTEVVAPEWRMTAAVVQADQQAEEYTIATAEETVGNLHAGIGYIPDNPFSSPTKGEKYSTPKDDLQHTADYMIKVFKDWGAKQFDTTDPNVSGPDLKPPKDWEDPYPPDDNDFPDDNPNDDDG